MTVTRWRAQFDPIEPFLLLDCNQYDVQYERACDKKVETKYVTLDWSDNMDGSLWEKFAY